MKISLRAILLFAGALSAVSSPCALAHTDVTVAEARDLIASTSDLTVVDVREPYEYCDARGHIPGALNYPWSSGVLRARYEELPADGPILVICRSGGRSNAAASFLDSQGFSEVYDMLRGMNAWQWETAPCKYSGGAGTADDPYQIGTAEDLIALGESPDDYDKHFILTADIDLDPNLPGRKVFERAVIAPDANDMENGYQGTPFTGVFDGNGHIISHMTMEGESSLGLFGVLGRGAMISGVALQAVDVNGTGDYVGGLGGISSADVTSCCSSGTINGRSAVGGLVGMNEGNLTECYSTGTVSGTGGPAFPPLSGDGGVGGLVGTNRFSGGKIVKSHSSSEVIGDSRAGGLVGINGGVIAMSYSTGSIDGISEAGGLVGANYMSPKGAEFEGDISTSHSSGTVTAHTFVGGLVGVNAGNIAASYSTSPISGVSQVGGLVGANDIMGGSMSANGSAFGYITQSYSVGAVIGEAEVGGLAGRNWQETGISSSFWDVETSGQITSSGGTGLTSTQMQTSATFLDTGWDFVDESANGPNDVWWICEGQAYPRLWWEEPKHVFEIEIALGVDFEDPDDPNDTVHEFELTVVTDGCVQRLEFVTPSGSLFEIPNLPQHEQPVPGGWLETAWEYDDEAGIYEWSYELKLDDPNGLADFGDGNYEIATYYEDATRQQTTARIGIPGTEEPIPQPVQEPVMMSLSDGDIVTSPVAITWKAPIDPAINQVLLALARQDAPEWLDFELEKDATGIAEPVPLSEGPWAADLVLAARYSYKNADKVQIECRKDTESSYSFTVAP